MVVPDELTMWFAHRMGEQQLPRKTAGSFTKAFDLSDSGRELIDTFGQREIVALVGFLDIAGFSGCTQGKSPAEIAAYLQPFLQDLVSRLSVCRCAIDKTIGDEVMFVLPDREAETGTDIGADIEGLMGSLEKLHRAYGKTHPFRVGLAFGELRIDRIAGDGYKEWTSFGETVHLAKRLEGLKELEQPQGLVGAFGVLLKEEQALNRFETLLSEVVLEEQVTNRYERLDNLKGVSPAKVVIFNRSINASG